jgi:hypothetical protein
MAKDDPVANEHVVKIDDAGTDCMWSCSCGRRSRHQLPYHLTVRNARSHERKYNRKDRGKRTVTDA